MKLGKRPARQDDRTLRLGAYMAAEVIPAAPVSVDYASEVTSWPMLANDVHGDCTCAAAGHLVLGWSAREGHPKQVTDDDVLGLYGLVNHGVDDGAVCLDVLNAWRQTGLAGDQIAAYAAVDISQPAHLRAALWLFGGLYLGVQLPLAVQGADAWTVVPGSPGCDPGSWGGHAVSVHGYDAEGLTVVTWGRTLRCSWEFLAAYCDEAYAVLDETDWLGDVPGIDLEQLRADLAAVAALTPPPSPGATFPTTAQTGGSSTARTPGIAPSGRVATRSTS